MAINMLAASVPASALASIEADPSVVQIAPIETHSAQLNISVPSLGAPSFWSAGYTGSGHLLPYWIRGDDQPSCIRWEANR